MLKIAVVGNGSLGLMAAIEARRNFPDAEITVVGPTDRQFAASTAAGAMANVYAEMEHTSSYLAEVNERYLEMGKLGSRGWKEFLADTEGNHCITSNDTYVYLQKNASNFEQMNFQAVNDYARADEVLHELSSAEVEKTFPINSKVNIERAIRIIGEFSLSVSELFAHLDSLARKNRIKFVESKVDGIDSLEMLVETQLGPLKFDRIIVTAGAHSKLLLGNSSMITIFQGVGVAMLINPVRNLEMDKLRNGVFRSVNRGGAQCGIHLVPREDGKFYLGAGNYVSTIQKPTIRLDTIRYLLSTLEKDLVGRECAYELTGEFKLGLRPRSLDGFPMIGPLMSNPKIFVATGTNRAGLTWAPFISMEIVEWLKDSQGSQLTKGWDPERAPIPFGSRQEGIDYFVQSRISNSFEHGLVERTSEAKDLEEKRQEFVKTANLLADQVSKNLGLSSSITVNPDNWAAIIASD
jgi:glycine/D-amino acid oxidase-like deaminating enzyme